MHLGELENVKKCQRAMFVNLCSYIMSTKQKKASLEENQLLEVLNSAHKLIEMLTEKTEGDIDAQSSIDALQQSNLQVRKRLCVYSAPFFGQLPLVLTKDGIFLRMVFTGNCH